MAAASFRGLEQWDYIVKIAFIGTRGVPASYSGFETFVEELGVRLAEAGHEVTVYGRKHHHGRRPRDYRGMRLRFVFGIRTKHLDTISHTLVSSLDALRRQYDIVVMCISGNSPAAVIPRLSGAKVVLNVDGSDWRRRKWGRLARTYIRLSEKLAVTIPNATVTDSRVMHRYYKERLGAETICIAYGADMPAPETTGILERLGIQPRRYLLFVGRLVPENCADHLVRAYEELHPDMACVVVGDAPYDGGYIAQLHRMGPHVIFPGYVFGVGYRELMHNAYAVVLCSEVGGTHPVLVEAMAAGNCVIVNDTPANLEVIDNAGLSYPGRYGSRGLVPVLDRLIKDPELVSHYRERARARAYAAYSWDRVTEQYLRLFRSLLGEIREWDEETMVAAGGPTR